MGFSNFLQKIFGTKAQRDMREIQPMVDKIKAVYAEIDKLSHDALRAKTQELKARIAKSAEAENAKIAEIRTKIESTDIDAREPLYKEIDKLEKQIKENLEAALIRIEKKSYGICRVTGKLIPKERLRLVPHATLTVEAKEMLAKSGKN